MALLVNARLLGLLEILNDKPVHLVADTIGGFARLMHGILIRLDQEHESDSEPHLLFSIEQIGLLHPVEEDPLVRAHSIHQDEVIGIEGLDDLIEELKAGRFRPAALNG